VAGHYESTDEVLVPKSTRNFWSNLIDFGGGLRWEKPTFLCLLTSNRCIRIKNTLGLSGVVFCACRKIESFSLLFLC
jgi:hypothetical protein